jgi:hypothetical protein
MKHALYRLHCFYTEATNARLAAHDPANHALGLPIKLGATVDLILPVLVSPPVRLSETPLNSLNVSFQWPLSSLRVINSL